MVLAAIVACEVAFWVVILAGLVARYRLHRPRLSVWLFFCAPLIDAVLLVLVAIDLLGGGTASWQHALAAVYIGASVAYGRRMVAWADVRFAHRFAGGPKPERLSGAAYTRKCWRDVLLTTLMVAIAGAIIAGLILLIGDPARTAALSGFFGVLGIVFAADLLWAVSYTIWPKKPVAQSQSAF
ncbi:hypothetical protein ACFVWR_17710 [Leifsonia sp. NPDC058292]|uniref:hypothetical protein n=1 Tax=Leifsonia sp. NPDC058292 TaxID=3346428 RepID=UPI0036DD4316